MENQQTHTLTQATQEESAISSALQEEAPFKVFASKEEYQAHFDRILGQRLKNARKNAERLERLEPLVTALQRQFGVSGEEELVKLISLPEGNLSAGQDRQDDTTANMQISQTLQRELASAAEEDAAYASIDTDTLVKDRRFMAMLAQGVGVREAYDALHPDEAARRISQKTSRQIVNNILARGSRPPESALAAGAGAFMPDVASMGGDEIDALLKRVQHGESISF